MAIKIGVGSCLVPSGYDTFFTSDDFFLFALGV